MKLMYTPGPWSFYTSPQPNGCPIVGTVTGLMVCMLAHSLNEPEQHDEAIANARIISATPELLSSLIDTLDFLERHSNRWDGVNGKHPNTVATRARSAIAKATKS